jgi:hypothetical protein
MVKPIRLSLVQYTLQPPLLDFEVSMPMMQGSEGATFDQVKDLADQVQKEEGKKGQTTLELPVEDLFRTLESLESIRDESAGVEVFEKKGNIAFSRKSSFGSAIERRRIKVENWSGKKFSMNPDLFSDTLSCYTGENVTLYFSEKTIAFFNETGSTKTTYSCLLK